MLYLGFFNQNDKSPANFYLLIVEEITSFPQFRWWELGVAFKRCLGHMIFKASFHHEILFGEF